ncbi:ABC transporter substrate-binding protein [Ornithinimicrobium panacihumi]|uniref:ABC transporter substrate-binding protein n=1 Tax=Ornithinimicrobium panacihumi TaxID=2008449 RepID=UPI003F89FD73
MSTPRRPLSLLALVAVTGLLGACAGTGGGTGGDSGGNDNGGSTAGSGGDAAGGKVESLTFWSNHPGGSKETEEAIIKAYEEETGIKVNLVTAGANYEEVANRFNAAQAGGDVPDLVVASDVTWFPMMLNGALAPLDELWTSQEVDSDAYVDALREDYNYNDEHFAMPYARSTPLFYYNKDMWAAAGLPDRGPETWEEFAEWAPKLKEANDGKAPLTIPDGSNYLDWYFQGMIWTFGGSYSDEFEPNFTSEGSIKAGEFLQQQVKDEMFVIATDPNSDFAAGQAAALLQSTGSLGGLTESAEFDFGTAFLPGPKPGVTTGGAGVGISSKISAERQAAAMDFLEFLTNTDNTVTFSQATGYMPVRKDAAETDAVKSYLEENPNFKTALDQLPDTQSQDYARVFVPGGGARIGAALDKITTGGEDVKATFEALQEETQQVIDRDVTPQLEG